MKVSLAQLGMLIALVAAHTFASDVAVLQNGNSIRSERHEVIGAVTRLYTGNTNEQYVDIPTAQIDHFEHDLTPALASTQNAVPASPKIEDVVNAASDHSQLDPDLIASVIHVESGFNPHAVSRKGAQGLMQLMPQTASNLGVTNAFDPAQNVDGGTRYLRELLDRYNFDLIKALAAYNAGPQRVEQYHGVPPYYETQAYVARIVRDFNRKKLAERKVAQATAKMNSGKQHNTAKTSAPKKPPQSSSGSLASANMANVSVSATRP